jgi:tetratricopeptide (TPR) repeat protein
MKILLMGTRKSLKAVFILCSIGLLISSGGIAYGQSNLKEGYNQYALYSKSGDIKLLDNARKFADDAYKTRKDTTNFRNNLLRALVYSTLSVVDSNRKKTYKEDPIVVATRALNKLKDKQLVFESEPEINHTKRYISNAHMILGNRAVAKKNYQEAYRRFFLVDSIGSISNPELRYNLAVLSQKNGKLDDAIREYQILMSNQKTNRPIYYIALSDLYQAKKQKQQALEVLTQGRDRFSNDRDLLFKLVDFYQKNGEYASLLDIIDDAIKYENRNTDLYYLAGYANDVLGNFEIAKGYYENLIDLDPQHYKGNYALGLIYLRQYLENPTAKNNQTKAEDFLLRANQIMPTGYNALKSLAILYEKDDNIIQLERVNNILNQLSFN